MLVFLKRLCGKCLVMPPERGFADCFNPLLLGVWAPIGGDPSERVIFVGCLGIRKWYVRDYYPRSRP